MARDNELAQLMEIIEQIQIRLDESEKKIELLATTLQNFIKNSTKEKGEKSHKSQLRKGR